MKEAKAPLQIAAFSEMAITSSVFFLYRRYSKASFTKALTVAIPCSVSSTITLESAILSCASFERPFIFFPKIIAITITTGTNANINKVSFPEIKVNNPMPIIITKIWRKNSAMVVVSVSCSKEISDEILLVNSPTLRSL